MSSLPGVQPVSINLVYGVWWEKLWEWVFTRTSAQHGSNLVWLAPPLTPTPTGPAGPHLPASPPIFHSAPTCSPLQLHGSDSPFSFLIAELLHMLFIPSPWSTSPCIFYLVKSSHHSSLCSGFLFPEKPSWTPNITCYRGFLYLTLIALIIFTFIFVVISVSYAPSPFRT